MHRERVFFLLLIVLLFNTSFLHTCVLEKTVMVLSFSRVDGFLV